VAVLQYVGIDILGAWPSGWRQPSFVGISELGTLGGAALAIGFVGLLRPGTVQRRVALVALVGGTLCVVLSGGIADQLGVVLAAAGAVAARCRWRTVVAWGRVVLVGAITVVCGLGVLGAAARRPDPVRPLRRTRQGRQIDEQQRADVRAARASCTTIGLRVWLDKPVLGAGWQSIREQQVYEPFLADAHRRYSGQPEQAFPHEADPKRQYGIDNAYIQALAELGAVGFLLSSRCSAAASSAVRGGHCEPRPTQRCARSPACCGCSSRWEAGRASASSRARRSPRSRGSRSGSSPRAQAAERT